MDASCYWNLEKILAHYYLGFEALLLRSSRTVIVNISVVFIYSIFYQKGINLSIIAPRTVPELQNLYNKVFSFF